MATKPPIHRIPRTRPRHRPPVRPFYPTGGRKRGHAERFRGSERWRVMVDGQLLAFPWCCDPFGDHGGDPARAVRVHHIIAIEVDFDLAEDPGNLVSLCGGCYGFICTVDRRGGDTVRLLRDHARTKRP